MVELLSEETEDCWSEIFMELIPLLMANQQCRRTEVFPTT